MPPTDFIFDDGEPEEASSAPYWHQCSNQLVVSCLCRPQRLLRWRQYGNLVPLPEEAAQQQAEREGQRADILAARLLELGIDPNSISESNQ